MKLVLGRQNPTFSVVAVQLRADITYSKATVSVIIDERGLNKYVRDYINEVDELYFAISKALTTEQQVDDLAAITLSKPFTDGYTTSDLVSRYVGFNRNFADSVGQQDLLLGFAVVKNILDSVTALESLSGFSMNKPLTDTQNIFDNADVNNGDGLEYTDVKPAADLVEQADLAVNSVGKALQDAITPLENLSAVLGKTVFDMGVVGDNCVLSTEKAVSDVYLAADTLTSVFDAVRTITDSTLTIDLLASIGVEKLLTEAYMATSSGSLRMTDYVDITYLAEDYVGTSTTFS